MQGTNGTTNASKQCVHFIYSNWLSHNICYYFCYFVTMNNDRWNLISFIQEHLLNHKIKTCLVNASLGKLCGNVVTIYIHVWLWNSPFNDCLDYGTNLGRKTEYHADEPVFSLCFSSVIDPLMNLLQELLKYLVKRSETDNCRLVANMI